MKKCLPTNVKTTISYEGIKLLSQFFVKDKTKLKHKHKFFWVNVQMVNCKYAYEGKLIKESLNAWSIPLRDKNVYILKHFRGSHHTHLWKNDFEVLNSNYRKNIKRKINEALDIRTTKPNLNIMEKLMKLKMKSLQLMTFIKV